MRPVQVRVGEQWVSLRKEERAAQGEGGYYYNRYDHALASGQAAGSVFHTYEFWQIWVIDYGETIPSKYASMFQLDGQDEGLFVVEYPGEVSPARPLPAGEYRFYFIRMAEGARRLRRTAGGGADEQRALRDRHRSQWDST